MHVPERQTSEKLFTEILFTLRVFAINLLKEEVTEVLFFFLFYVMSDLGLKPWPHGK